MMTAGQRAQILQAQKRLGMQGMSQRGQAMAAQAAQGQGVYRPPVGGHPGAGSYGSAQSTAPPKQGAGGAYGNTYIRDVINPRTGGSAPNSRYPTAGEFNDPVNGGRTKTIPQKGDGSYAWTPPAGGPFDEGPQRTPEQDAAFRASNREKYANMARYMPNAPASLIRQLQKAGVDTSAQDISGASEHIQQGFGEREGQKLWSNAVSKSLGEKRGGPTAAGGISWNDPNVPGFEHGDPSGYWQQKAIENQKGWAAGGGNKPRPPGEGPNAWGPSEVPPGQYNPAPETAAQAPAQAPQQDPNFAGNPEAPTGAPSNYQTQEQATMYNGVAGQPPDYNQFVQQLQNAMSGQGGPQGQQFMQQIMSQLQGMQGGGQGYYQPYGMMGNYGMGSPYQMGGYGYF